MNHLRLEENGVEMKKHAICFVDDDQEEIKRFREALKGRFVIGAGQNPDSALEDLTNQGRKKPDLFLLDLYFPEEGLPTDEDLEKLHDARAAYLKAATTFRTLLTQLNQTSEGGFKIARDLRQNHRIGIAFFTRKGTLEDAISAYEDHHAVSVIKKPDPNPEDVGSGNLSQAYDNAIKDGAERLEGHILRAIRRASWWGQHRDLVLGLAIGFAGSLAATVAYNLI